MNTSTYLRRIGIDSSDHPNIHFLTHLQQQHLLHVPFENLDIHLGKKITLDYDAIFKKVVDHRRGGFCYELNGLFYLLLKNLGYEVRRVSARVRGDSGRIGKEFDHMAIIVHLDKKEWLVDVGFGKFSFAPINIDLGVEQEDARGIFKIEKYDETYHGVFVKEETESWRLGYLFTFQHREPTEFAAMCHHQQTSPESNFTKRRLVTLPNLNGRVTLTDSKLKILKNGETIESEVQSDQNFREFLMRYFGMEYEY